MSLNESAQHTNKFIMISFPQIALAILSSQRIKNATSSWLWVSRKWEYFWDL